MHDFLVLVSKNLLMHLKNEVGFLSAKQGQIEIAKALGATSRNLETSDKRATN
jgi:hypothetical protein